MLWQYDKYLIVISCLMPGTFPGRRPDRIGSAHTSHTCSCVEAGPVPACVTQACLGNKFGSFGPAHGQSAITLGKKNKKISAVVGTDLKFLCDTFIPHAKGQPLLLISRTSAAFGCFSIFSAHNWSRNCHVFTVWCKKYVMEKNVLYWQAIKS